MSLISKTRSRGYGIAALALAALGAAGCNKDKLLEVTVPSILNIEDYSTPDGAEPLRVGVIARFNTAFDGSADSFITMTGTAWPCLLAGVTRLARMFTVMDG